MSTFVGVLLSLSATMGNGLGYILQKLAHRRVDEAAEAAAAHAAGEARDGPVPSSASAAAPAPLPFWRYWQFGAGLLCCVAAAGLDVASYGFAAQSQLGPIGATTLVWVALLSWRVLKERFTRLDALSTGLMLTGTVVALVASKGVPDEKFNLDIILAKLQRPVVGVYLGLAGAVGGLGAFAIARWSRLPPHALPPREMAADAVARPFVAGLLAGSTGLNVKAFVSIITNAGTVHSTDDFRHVQPYIFLVALVSSLVLQLSFLNSGLARYDANRIVPVYQITLVFCQVATGWICWGEAAQQSALSLSFFGVGIALSCAGIGVLALKPAAPVPPPDETALAAPAGAGAGAMQLSAIAPRSESKKPLLASALA